MVAKVSGVPCFFDLEHEPFERGIRGSIEAQVIMWPYISRALIDGKTGYVLATSCARLAEKRSV
jgi:hypothetical protein